MNKFNFINWVINSYSNLIFSSDKKIGICILLLSFLDPHSGLLGLVSTILILSFAIVFGVHEDRILKGPYGLNGLLFGLSLNLYHDINLNLFLILTIGVILLLFISILQENIFGIFFNLPVLSLPFVTTSLIVYFAQLNYSGFATKTIFVFPLNQYFPELPSWLEFYFKSLGGVFFQSSPWAGFFLSLLILVSSRIFFLLSLFGFLISIWFHSSLNGSSFQLLENPIGFNFILTSIAIGGYFIVPSGASFVLAILAAIVSGIIASFGKIFLLQYYLPVLAFPFNITVLLFLYVTKLLHNKKLIPIDFTPGTAEENLDYYKTRLERFGVHGLYIRLPFMGKWKVSQGYSGEYTHKDKWKESLDFVAVNNENQIRKNKSDIKEDYFCFGLPVLATCSGKVVKVINHLEDNVLNEIDAQNNWGNLVLIEHSFYLYSQVSHLQKNSILVKEGEYIQAGTKLGLVGNSGRSPFPHLHLHFQGTPEIGSSTIPISFTQYLDETDNPKIKFNSIPNENDFISHLSSDYNLKNFFNIIPEEKYKIFFIKNGKEQIDIWKAKLDFWGYRYLEDEQNNRLYFSINQDFFSCIDYIGKYDSSLFYFFLSSYRIPFSKINSLWEDKISYKFFSNFYEKFFKDIIQPFSDRFSFIWKAKLEETVEGTKIISNIINHNGDRIASVSILVSINFPGEIILNVNQSKFYIRSDE